MITLELNQASFAKAQISLERMTDLVKSEMFRIVELSAIDVQTTAKRPGYVPVDTGTLKRSITHTTVKGNGEVTGYVGSNVVYARIHELGGTTGRGHKSVITPKRYLTRAVEDNQGKIAERFKQLALISGKI